MALTIRNRWVRTASSWTVPGPFGILTGVMPWSNEALRTELNLNVSGGGQKNQYFFSAGYLNDKGIALESGYQRFNLRSNITSEMTSSG